MTSINPKHFLMKHLKWVLLSALLLLLCPLPSWSHAVLLQSNPPHGATLQDPPATVTLRFNVALEGIMTRLNLVDLHQHETSLPLTEGPQANQVIAELPPLSPGVYLVRYKVLARDGHISEGEIRFTVLGA